MLHACETWTMSGWVSWEAPDWSKIMINKENNIPSKALGIVRWWWTLMPMWPPWHLMLMMTIFCFNIARLSFSQVNPCIFSLLQSLMLLSVIANTFFIILCCQNTIVKQDHLYFFFNQFINCSITEGYWQGKSPDSLGWKYQRY